LQTRSVQNGRHFEEWRTHLKTTITIQDGQVRLSLTPETDIEKLTIRELGDDISVSRSHEGIVLRPRAKAQNVRKINDSEQNAEPIANAN
jgi:hypothetical protein